MSGEIKVWNNIATPFFDKSRVSASWSSRCLVFLALLLIGTAVLDVLFVIFNISNFIVQLINGLSILFIVALSFLVSSLEYYSSYLRDRAELARRTSYWTKIGDPSSLTTLFGTLSDNIHNLTLTQNMFNHDRKRIQVDEVLDIAKTAYKNMLWTTKLMEKKKKQMVINLILIILFTAIIIAAALMANFFPENWRDITIQLVFRTMAGLFPLFFTWIFNVLRFYSRTKNISDRSSMFHIFLSSHLSTLKENDERSILYFLFECLRNLQEYAVLLVHRTETESVHKKYKEQLKPEIDQAVCDLFQG